MSELEKNMADYFVVCVREFSKRHSMASKDALLYLDKYGGLDLGSNIEISKESGCFR